MITLDLDGKEQQFEIDEESSFISQHTGRELQRLVVTVRVIEKGKDWLEDFLQKSDKEGIRSTDGEGNLVKRWSGRIKQYIFSNRESSAECKVELNEKEIFTIDVLEIGTLSLKPYFYSETFEKGLLFIRAKVVLSESEFNSLESFREKVYFPVVRRGINEIPVEMRFGRCMWSRHENGNKYFFYMVDKGYDTSDKRGGMLEPQMSNIQVILSKNVGIVDGLLKMLKEKNVLSDEEIQEIKSKALDEMDRHLDEFDRVKDVDDWE